LKGGEGRDFNKGEGRGGENFNYLYVWFKRGEERDFNCIYVWFTRGGEGR
jgi:hypothetical protein